MKFAKLFDLQNGEQLLAVLGVDDEDNDTLTITTEVSGLRTTYTFTGEGESGGITTAFAELDQGSAEKHWRSLAKQLADALPE